MMWPDVTRHVAGFLKIDFTYAGFVAHMVLMRSLDRLNRT
jgi:hypothetical protein